MNKFSISKGVLGRHGLALTSVTMQQGIQVGSFLSLLLYFSLSHISQDFFAWCRQLSEQHDGRTIVLVAHNGRNVG